MLNSPRKSVKRHGVRVSALHFQTKPSTNMYSPINSPEFSLLIYSYFPTHETNLRKFYLKIFNLICVCVKSWGRSGNCATSKVPFLKRNFYVCFCSSNLGKFTNLGRYKHKFFPKVNTKLISPLFLHTHLLFFAVHGPFNTFKHKINKKIFCTLVCLQFVINPRSRHP